MYAKVKKKDNRLFLEIQEKDFVHFIEFDENEFVLIKKQKTRSLQVHQNYFAMLDLFVTNAPDSLICELLNIDNSELIEIKLSSINYHDRVRKAIEVKIGFVEQRTLTISGTSQKIVVDSPKSISFEKMQDDEFLQLHRHQKDWIFATLSNDYGWSKEMLVEGFGGFYNY